MIYLFWDLQQKSVEDRFMYIRPGRECMLSKELMGNILAVAAVSGNWSVSIQTTFFFIRRDFSTISGKAFSRLSQFSITASK